MSGPANLSGALPDGPGNGLAAIAAELISNPSKVHVVVALLDTVKIVETVDDGGRKATVRIRRVEVITDPDDAARMRNLLQREFERRTGQVVLPFELEEDVRQAFEVPSDEPDGAP